MFHRMPTMVLGFLQGRCQTVHALYAQIPCHDDPSNPRKIISRYGKKGGILFDPYLGTGTSLVEGYIHGMRLTGTDLNPLARLITKVKSLITMLKIWEKLLKYTNSGYSRD